MTKLIDIKNASSCLPKKLDKFGRPIYTGDKTANYKHGLEGTKFYIVWEGIVARCTNPKSTSWKNYGARGIKNYWIKFIDFKNDMYESYQIAVKKHGKVFIDRIDNNGHYCKENCQWVDLISTANNKRNNVFVTINGVKKTAITWCREYGTSHPTFINRRRNGWDLVEAITTPPFGKGYDPMGLRAKSRKIQSQSRILVMRKGN